MAKRFGKKDVGQGDVRMDEATQAQGSADAVDPALVARLEAWFGNAGPDEPESEAPHFVPGFGYVAAETARDRWRRERALEAVANGTLWGELERRGRTASALVEPLPPMHLTVEKPLSRFDLDRWGIPAPPQEVDRHDIEDVREAMADHVPQAVLRDLHRPVMQVGEIELEQRVIDTRGTEQTALIRALVRARYGDEIQRITRASAQAAELMSELRKRLDEEPWEDARPENPSTWGPSAVDMAELMRWFNTGDG